MNDLKKLKAKLKFVYIFYWINTFFAIVTIAGSNFIGGFIHFAVMAFLLISIFDLEGKIEELEPPSEDDRGNYDF